jgi:hypothetical protein
MGRLEDFKEKWVEEFKEWPTEKDYNCLLEFAVEYPQFLNTLFPNIVQQFKLLEEMVALLMKELS